MAPFRIRAGGGRGHDIDAGREIADRLIDRERGGDLGVERLLDGELALPDADAAVLGEAFDVVAVEAALEVVAQHGVDQVAVADPVDFDRHRPGVDGDDRNAALAGAGQHIGLGGEAHERLAVAHIDAELGRFRQRLVDGRRQAGAQRDGIALAVLEPFDAKLLVLDRERRLVDAGDRHERREVGALARQAFRELEAGARRSGVGIDRIVEQAEAVVAAHAFIERAHLGDLAEFEREAKRVERRPPALEIALAAAEDDEAVGLLAAVPGQRVGLVGGGAGALEQQIALALVGRTDLLDGAGQPQPARALGRRRRDDLAEQHHAVAEIVLLEGGVGFAAKLRQRLGVGASLALDLRFELDGGFGERRDGRRLYRRHWKRQR